MSINEAKLITFKYECGFHKSFRQYKIARQILIDAGLWYI